CASVASTAIQTEPGALQYIRGEGERAPTLRLRLAAPRGGCFTLGRPGGETCPHTAPSRLQPDSLRRDFMPSLTRSSVLKTGLAGVFLSLLAACAGPSSIQLGTPVQQVLTQQGQATLDYPRPGGGQRFIWSGQPMGQFTWITDTDAQGLVIDNFQALTSERFTQLDHGEWDSNRVMYEFGPPAEISRVGLRAEHIVWS